MIKGLNPIKRGNMKNYHIKRCIELIEEMKLLIYKENRPLVQKDIESRLNYLKEVFLIQKGQNDSRINLIRLSKSMGAEKKHGDKKTNKILVMGA